MRIRSAGPGDARSVATVHVDSWRAGYAGRFPDDYLAGLDVDRAEEIWHRALIWPATGSTTLVSIRGDVVTGFVQVGPTREEDLDATGWGEVAMLYVSPPCWAGGIGRALLSRGVEELRSAGFCSAHLWVLDGNERAERLYAGAGWHRTGRTKTDDSRGFPIEEAFWALDRLG